MPPRHVEICIRASARLESASRINARVTANVRKRTRAHLASRAHTHARARAGYLVYLFMHSKSRMGGGRGKGHFADTLTKSRESTSASTDEAATFSPPSFPVLPLSDPLSGLYASYEIREKSGASGTAREIKSRDACPVGGTVQERGKGDKTSAGGGSIRSARTI